MGRLQRRRERRGRVVEAADELRAADGDQARYEAILFAQLSREGKLFEPGRDAQFWWEVVLELDRRAGRRGHDTATRYLQEP